MYSQKQIYRLSSSLTDEQGKSLLKIFYSQISDINFLLLFFSVINVKSLPIFQNLYLARATLLDEVVF